MSTIQKTWQSRLKIILIGIGVYYLLYFILFSLSYSPNCSLNGNFWDFLYWFADLGRFPCATVEAGIIILTPITFFFETGWLFSGLGLIVWYIETAVYVLVFILAYK